MFQIKFFIEAFFWGDRMMSEVQTLNDSFLDGNFPFSGSSFSVDNFFGRVWVKLQ